MVRGRQITVSNAVIVEISGLPTKGPVWVTNILKLHDAIETFMDEGQELIKKRKGVQTSSLGEPWGELARIL